MRALSQLLEVQAHLVPENVAVEDPASGGAITYAELQRASDLVRDRLMHWGIGRGDRVGIYLRKSIDAIATIFGILKTGAAYVPVDPHAPAARNAYVFEDCAVRAVVVERGFVDGLCEQVAASGDMPRLLVLDGAGDGEPLGEALAEQQAVDPAPRTETELGLADDLAYLLYTSGSTGKPKGVMLSRMNAWSFINWCAETFEPTKQDRFSSHAPLHFDLSILDIYVPIKHGATLILISHETGKDPARLAALIAERRITAWYSTPSILSLLARHGALDSHDFSALRLVLFAGEVFPVKHLRQLKQQWPHPRYFNLYGPTETNVCTFFEIPATIPPERSEPYPIGRLCKDVMARVVDGEGRDVAPGDEGELCIRGPTVTSGYWGLDELTRRAFLVETGGQRWYRTGDLVVEDPVDGFIYRGRRDRMVKKRGYRVELGEIEACLYQHPEIRQVAVIATQDEEEGLRIKAVVSPSDGRKLSIISLKRFCAERIPPYMVPDVFTFLPALPTTSTDKVDYQALQEIS